jgi:hypothetical protein
MVGFVNLQKVIARRNACSTLPSAQNGGELKKWGIKSRLKHQISQVVHSQMVHSL